MRYKNKNNTPMLIDELTTKELTDERFTKVNPRVDKLRLINEISRGAIVEGENVIEGRYVGHDDFNKLKLIVSSDRYIMSPAIDQFKVRTK